MYNTLNSPICLVFLTKTRFTSAMVETWFMNRVCANKVRQAMTHFQYTCTKDSSMLPSCSFFPRWLENSSETQDVLTEDYTLTSSIKAVWSNLLAQPEISLLDVFVYSTAVSVGTAPAPVRWAQVRPGRALPQYKAASGSPSPPSSWGHHSSAPISSLHSSSASFYQHIPTHPADLAQPWDHQRPVCAHGLNLPPSSPPAPRLLQAFTCPSAVCRRDPHHPPLLLPGMDPHLASIAHLCPFLSWCGPAWHGLCGTAVTAALRPEQDTGAAQSNSWITNDQSGATENAQ